MLKTALESKQYIKIFDYLLRAKCLQWFEQKKSDHVAGNPIKTKATADIKARAKMTEIKQKELYYSFKFCKMEMFIKVILAMLFSEQLFKTTRDKRIKKNHSYTRRNLKPLNFFFNYKPRYYILY